MPSHPPETIPLPTAVLTRTLPADSQPIAEAVGSALDHLSPWMPWASAESAIVAHQQQRIEQAQRLWEEGQEFTWLLRATPSGPVLGTVGLHRRIGPGGIEIGYWLHPDGLGRGLATAAAGAVGRAAWTLPDVERVEIHTDEANVHSAAVPRRLGYVLERVDEHPPEAPAESGRRQIWIARGAPEI